MSAAEVTRALGLLGEPDAVEVFVLLLTRHEAHGIPWTRRELHEATGLSHVRLGRAFRGLEQARLLRVRHGQPRAYALTGRALKGGAR